MTYITCTISSLMENKKGKHKLQELLKKSQNNITAVSRQAQEEITRISNSAGVEKIKDTFRIRKNLAKSDRLLKNKKKFATAVQKAGTDIQHTGKKLVTNTGRFVNQNQEVIATIGGIIAGLTLNELFLKENEHNPEVISSYEINNQIITEYIEIIETNPEDLSFEDWIGLIANISKQLEALLRFQTGVNEDYKKGMHDLINKAAKQKLISKEERTELHQFREIRNKALHTASRDIVDTELILWVAKFLLDMQKETIVDTPA